MEVHGVKLLKDLGLFTSEGQINNLKKIEKKMKKILIELMSRITHFVTQSIDWYDGLDEFILFFLVFFLEKTAFDLLAFCSLANLFPSFWLFLVLFWML